MKRILFLAFVSFAMALPLFALPHESVIDIFEGCDFRVFPMSLAARQREATLEFISAQKGWEFAIINNGRKLYAETVARSSYGGCRPNLLLHNMK